MSSPGTFRFSPNSDIDESLLSLFSCTPENEEPTFPVVDTCMVAPSVDAGHVELWSARPVANPPVGSPDAPEHLMNRILASRSPSPNDFDVSALLQMRSKSPSPPGQADFHAPELDLRDHSAEPPYCDEGNNSACGWKGSASSASAEKAPTFTPAKAEHRDIGWQEPCAAGPSAGFATCENVGRESECEQTARANANGKKRRGMHVAEKPEMPQTARDGQHDWQLQKQPLEEEWELRAVGENELFKTQIEKCKLACKNQKLCLLFVLQLFVVDGVIQPSLNEALMDSVEESFFGWTGFRVNSAHSQWFRSRLESLWPGPNPPREATLNNAFRRCGFVPSSSWEAAIRGHGDAAFTYKKCKEYKKQKTAAGAASSIS